MHKPLSSALLAFSLQACAPIGDEVDANSDAVIADAHPQDDAQPEGADAATPDVVEIPQNEAGSSDVSTPPPACRTHVTLTVALYTGTQNPGEDGVPDSNGCWSYERVAKFSAAWRVCISSDEVSHPEGARWVFDDTNPRNDRATEQADITRCANGVAGSGYVYMAARDGLGWRRTGVGHVAAYFAELYSSQDTVDDLFGEWSRQTSVGAPMVNVGIERTTTSNIHDSVLRACRQVHDGGHVGIYVYPTPLDGARARAVVDALNECTIAR